MGVSDGSDGISGDGESDEIDKINKSDGVIRVIGAFFVVSLPEERRVSDARGYILHRITKPCLICLLI